MSKSVVNIEHKPVLGPEQVIGVTDMVAKINALPVTWKKVKVTDVYYYAPSWDGWRKAIDYEQPKLPKYYADKFDCENFAGWFRHKIAEDFGINTYAEVEGWADFQDGRGSQRHGWGVFTDGQYFYQTETQSGIIMDIDDKFYIPDEITMG